MSVCDPGAKHFFASALTSMKVGWVEGLWNLLGQSLSLAFGYDCASAAMLMFSSLFLRTFLVAFTLDHLVPTGFIFAFPSIVQVKSFETVKYMKRGYHSLLLRPIM